MKNRLSQVSLKRNGPFRTCYVTQFSPARPINAFKMTSHCYKNGVLRALESMLSELARVRKHGFSEKEIAVTREYMMSRNETLYQQFQSNQLDSAFYRDVYLEHFCNNEPALGIEETYRHRQAIYPEISASEVSSYSEFFRTSCSCVIHTHDHRASATVEDLKNVVLKINLLEENGSISNWVELEEQTSEEFVATKPKPGSVKDETVYPSIGATEMVLSNGMRVCYKRTDYEPKILIAGYAYGGLSELSESDYISCTLAGIFAQHAGMFGYRPSIMTSMLRGRSATMTANIGDYIRTFDGGCKPAELETALQMVYQLFITTVLPSDEDIKDVKENFEENVNAMERDPLTNFRNIEKKHTAGISYFNRPLKISDFQKVDASKACEFFTNSFKDPSDFVVVIVGDIDPATAKPLILKYLGGIPVHSQSLLKYHRDELTDLPFTLPTYIVREVVCSRMVDEKCIVSLCFRVEFNNENLLENMLFVLFFKMLFDSKINDVLRFEHGKIYSCDVFQHLNGVLSKAGTTLGKITLEFSCDPDSYEEPIDLTLKEILRLQKEGPSIEDISAQCAKDKRNCEDILQDNEGWIWRILDSYRSANYSGNIDFSFELQNEIQLKFWKQLTPEKAKMALQTILPFPCTELYTAVILKPEQRV